MSDGLRIGELAELAGTTTRAVRHYHAIGLIAEPERDESGYRRYGPDDLVAVVRIRRLRSLGMPLDQIGSHLGETPGDVGSALRALADDISRQIGELEDLRAKVLSAAAEDAPIEAWAAALRVGDLPAGEREAVELVDALHPQGIGPVADQASELLADPARAEQLEALLHRFRALPDDAGDAKIESLASDFAALMPRPANAPPPIDVDTMESLIGDRFSPAQRRCMRRVRELLEA